MSEAAQPSPPEPLPDMMSGSQIETEWNFFRQQWPRLLAEGQEGRWALIKGEEIIGLFDTDVEARSVGVRRFGLAPMLIQQILRHYRTVRAGGYWRCRP
jgi:hypothetical protein